MDTEFTDAEEIDGDMFSRSVELASSIYSNSMKCQNKNVVLHLKRQDGQDGQDGQDEERINSAGSESYLLFDHNNVKLTFVNKINHLTVRNCNNIVIKLNVGSVSGIDILSSKNLKIVCPHINFCEIAASAGVKLEFIDYQTIVVGHSIDCFFNNVKQMTNPFDRKIWTDKNADVIARNNFDSFKTTFVID